jgi:HK97 gp10 family phage protein
MRMSRTPLSREILIALTRTKEVKAQVRAVANEIRKEARRNAPRRTGNLARNIVVTNELDEEGRVEYRVGWAPAAWYGSLVEFGTEDIAARPHLRPAADRVNRELRG